MFNFFQTTQQITLPNKDGSKPKNLSKIALSSRTRLALRERKEFVGNFSLFRPVT
jgi:hypothetical protein